MTYMEIAGKRIGMENTYIISEIGSNHNQNIEQAKRLIRMSAEAGTDAVKFQLFDTDSLYKPSDKLYEIFKEIELNSDWLTELKNCAHDNGQAFVVSPFDYKSLNILVDLDIDAIKWASSETVKLAFLKKAASINKPLIISTGMCNLADVYEAMEVCLAENNSQVALLHCSSLYPTEPKHVNIRSMETLMNAFKFPVGFSDHTLDSTASIVAIAKGAKIIEKHITLDRNMKGPDHFYAIEPKELVRFVQAIRDVEKMFGSQKVEMLPEERKVARRDGIYASTTLKEGEIITDISIEVKRPALGIDKRFIDVVIGSKVQRDVQSGSEITWKDINSNK